MIKKAVGVVALSLGCFTQVNASACDPAQFVGKMYTEALGRAPDPDGFNAQYNHIKYNGCSLNSIKDVVRGVYLSSEFQSKTMINGSMVDWSGRVLSAYRGILNREPDSGGFSNFEANLSAGAMSWSQFVNDLANSAEFSSLYNSIKGGAYSFGSHPVIQIKRYSSEESWGAQDKVVSSDSQSTLQFYLNTSAPGSTVYLAPKQVIHLNSTLTIPSGVTLKTWGAPTPGEYTKMGRLVKAKIFNSGSREMVILNGGAKLKNVHVDGQRVHLGGGVQQHADGSVLMKPGSDSVLENNFLSNLMGNAMVKLRGQGEQPFWGQCNSSFVRYNVLTGYSTSLTFKNGAPDWQDGITSACPNSTIEYNQLIDFSDGGLTLFALSNGPVDHSSLKYNDLVMLNNRTVSMIVLAANGGSYAGTEVKYNKLWTGGQGYAHMAIVLGHGPWSEDSSLVGSNASVQYNTVPPNMKLRAETAIAIDGMLNANVPNNNIAYSQYEKVDDVDTTCPSVWIGAATSVDGGQVRASGYFPGATAPLDYGLCAGSTPK